MNFMKHERQVLNTYFPGLEDRLRSMDFSQRESNGSVVVETYREFGGPALLVPKTYGGKGATAVDAVAVHRALGLLSPSLAIAATMHDFTVAFLAEYAFYGDATRRYLQEIAQDNLYLASGFAEGRSGANILEPTMSAEAVDGGYRINGCKKPCSVSASMNYLTASVRLVDKDGELGQRAIAIIPATSSGIERSPFWQVSALAGAQSQEVRLRNVIIEPHNLFLPEAEVPLDAVEAGGFLWFELLITASYLGIASGIMEKIYDQRRTTAEERTRLLSLIETGAAALRGIAFEMQSQASPELDSEALVARVLLVRYGIQQQLGQIAFLGTELMGGMNFISDPTLEYSLACCAPLAFHPPSRLSIAQAIDGYMLGEALQMV